LIEFFNTNLGLVAAFDADSIHLLDQPLIVLPANVHWGPPPLHLDRDPSPCVSRWTAICGPADFLAIFALDADTGKMVWRQTSFLLDCNCWASSASI
jgi:hypothetical protein